MPLSQEFAASFGRLSANHLWQSTGFAAVAVLLAFALRANQARARYWLWLAASVKFLVPFSVLAAIGRGMGRWFTPATPVSRLPFVMEQIVQPFALIPDAAAPVAPSAPTPNLLPALLLAVWFCGFVTVLMYGWMRWRRVAAAVRSATPLTEGRELEALRRLASSPAGIRLVSSSAKLEPGVFGIFRPILWLPAGIADHLDDTELEAILAHELCHIRRHDNLLSVIHMAVEALFWFHPLVWWLGARLGEERERACDEEVVRMGGEPQVYAESILKVCEFYLASPVACAAGVTGGELKKRIEGIVTNRFTRKLSYGKRILLTTVAIVVIAGPIAVSLMNPPNGRAQSQARPAFGVASIKTDHSVSTAMGGTVGFKRGGSVSMRNVTAKTLIELAYGVEEYRVSGGPKWLAATKYDIDAKPEAPVGYEQARNMLQTLLADRFSLRVHHQTKLTTGYRLLVEKGGSKLKKSTLERVGFQVMSMDEIRGPGTMPNLVRVLTATLGAPIEDRTGLKDKYDIRLKWDLDAAEPSAAASGDAGPIAIEPTMSVFSALKQQLGLRLEASKVPVDLIVIDNLENPTAN